MSNPKARSFALHSTGYKELESKTCSICKTLKQISEYSKDPRASDGHRNECKRCFCKMTLARQHKAKKEKDFYSQFSPI